MVPPPTLMAEIEDLNMTPDDLDIITSNVQDEETPSTNAAEVPKKSFKFKLTVFMLCLTSVIVAMDSVIVAATLPAITVALKGESLEAFWVRTSYLLSQTVCFMPSDRTEPLK